MNKIKKHWEKAMEILATLFLPFLIIFTLVIWATVRECVIRTASWMKALMDFSFLTLDPPTRNHLEETCALYGMHGSLTELGNELIRKITGNCLSFYVGKKEDEMACFLVSTDGSNLPYRHLLMRIVRKNQGSYPITIHTHTGRRYEKINNEASLKIAFKEIIYSNETKTLLDSMMFVFWGQYRLSWEEINRESLVSTHGEEFIKKYEQLFSLKRQKNLITDKEREELVNMHMLINPAFALEVNEGENTDIDKLTLTRQLIRF